MFRTSKSTDASLVARLERAPIWLRRWRPRSQIDVTCYRKGFERSQAIGWLDTVIEEGRADLLAQRAINREIDAWEMSCRIMFMVAISASKSSRR
jgi:hypothetical protein